MSRATLIFTRERTYELTWDVWEKAETHELKYSGELAFSTGAEEGWWFTSSDSSIRWNLGPDVRAAKAELKRRYYAGRVAT